MASSHILASPALLMCTVGCDNPRSEVPGVRPYRRLLWSRVKNHLSASPARRAPSAGLGCPDLQDLMRGGAWVQYFELEQTKTRTEERCKTNRCSDRRLQRTVTAQSQGTARAWAAHILPSIPVAPLKISPPSHYNNFLHLDSSPPSLHPTLHNNHATESRSLYRARVPGRVEHARGKGVPIVQGRPAGRALGKVSASAKIVRQQTSIKRRWRVKNQPKRKGETRGEECGRCTDASSSPRIRLRRVESG
jgi:hypothetical protein